METNFPVLTKQFLKIHRLDLLSHMFDRLFKNIYNSLLSLMTNNNTDGLYDNDLLKLSSKGELRIKGIRASFTDMYTLGRLLKPGYDYCVFLGDYKRSRRVLELLEEAGFQMENTLTIRE